MTLRSDTRAGRIDVTLAHLEESDDFLDEVSDIPSQRALDPIPVAEAGVCDQPVCFTMPSFAEHAGTLTVTGTVTASAALPPSRRGVHMSRIVSSIDSLSDAHHGSLAAFLGDLVGGVSIAQDLAAADATFAGTTVVRRSTPMSGSSSPDRFGVVGRASLRDGRLRVWVGLRASVMTACPCTQAFSWYSTVLSIAEQHGVQLANELGRHIVGHTHSQRGQLEVEIESHDPAALEWVFNAMAEGAHLTHDLLKRPDEHDLVAKAHERPQFTEDVVRAVAARLLAHTSSSLSPQSEIRVSCRNAESIHAHDVHSVVRGRVLDFDEIQAASP